MDFHLDTLLNLPNVVADSYGSTLDAIVVKLQLVNAGINCPNCSEYISQLHQTRSVLVRDLSIFGQVVYLKVPRRQFYCSTCKKSPTEPLLWVNRKQRQTKLKASRVVISAVSKRPPLSFVCHQQDSVIWRRFRLSLDRSCSDSFTPKLSPWSYEGHKT
jgi:transposase